MTEVLCDVVRHLLSRRPQRGGLRLNCRKRGSPDQILSHRLDEDGRAAVWVPGPEGEAGDEECFYTAKELASALGSVYVGDTKLNQYYDREVPAGREVAAAKARQKLGRVRKLVADRGGSAAAVARIGCEVVYVGVNGDRRWKYNGGGGQGGLKTATKLVAEMARGDQGVRGGPRGPSEGGRRAASRRDRSDSDQDTDRDTDGDMGDTGRGGRRPATRRTIARRRDSDEDMRDADQRVPPLRPPVGVPPLRPSVGVVGVDPRETIRECMENWRKMDEGAMTMEECMALPCMGRLALIIPASAGAAGAGGRGGAAVNQSPYALALEHIRTQPQKCLPDMDHLPLYEQLPLEEAQLAELDDASKRLVLVALCPQVGKALVAGLVMLKAAIAGQSTFFFMGINARSNLTGIFEKVSRSSTPGMLSFFEMAGGHARGLLRTVWTDAPKGREGLLESIRGGTPNVIMALASSANIVSSLGELDKLDTECLSRVTVIIDEGHDRFDVGQSDSSTKLSAELRSRLFREERGRRHLRVARLVVLSACDGDLAGVVSWTGIERDAWTRLLPNMARLRSRGYVALEDLVPGIPAESGLRVSVLSAKNNFGLDRTGRFAKADDAAFIQGVSLNDVYPELAAYIDHYCDHPNAHASILVMRTSSHTSVGAHMFRTTRALMKLWPDKLSALVSWGEGVTWIKEDGVSVRYPTFRQAVDGVQADPDYSPRLLLVHANNMDGSQTIKCEARVPVACILAGMTGPNTNINTPINFTGRLCGYFRRRLLLGPDGEPEMPSVFAHHEEMELLTSVRPTQDSMFRNARAGSYARGMLTHRAGGLLAAGVRQGMGNNNVLGGLRDAVDEGHAVVAPPPPPPPVEDPAEDDVSEESEQDMEQGVDLEPHLDLNRDRPVTDDHEEQDEEEEVLERLAVFMQLAAMHTRTQVVACGVYAVAGREFVTVPMIREAGRRAGSNDRGTVIQAVCAVLTLSRRTKLNQLVDDGILEKSGFGTGCKYQLSQAGLEIVRDVRPEWFQ